jgi:hypothetical protein
MPDQHWSLHIDRFARLWYSALTLDATDAVAGGVTFMNNDLHA